MHAAPDSFASPLDDLLAQAMREHGEGRLDAARSLYAQILAAAPRHGDALHLSGVLEAQGGRYEEAAALIGRAIEADPRAAMFRNNLGNVHLECGRFDEAEACYIQAIELDPDRLDALNNLGVLFGRRGRPKEAVMLLERVIERMPDFADARINLANQHLREGRLAEAADQCVRGMVVAPRSPGLRRLLGVAYSMLGRNDQAIAVYRAWLDEEPGHPVAEFHLAACGASAPPERAPDAYVRQVFDSFATSFDAKLAALDYRAPQLVAGALERHGPAPAHALEVLDAGCGTGLCGPLLAPWARRLVGVDLSPGMLGKARARAVYDDLFVGELVAFLESRPAAFDLVVAADTLVYFGPLERFAAAAAACLRPGGLVIFTLEAEPDASTSTYRLHEHGRYSHRRPYVESALAGAGFEMLELTPAVPRSEALVPVRGWLVAARRGESR
ncbi:MAG: tetratricopeptide repeat protein [Burkholderiales bacterium]|nr:tetratricopeptide repeat protein [Burkholderiales bacterium]MDE2454130.1 tetratricopeptide repeat protein [Burkholderiales bacterium]